MKKKKKKGRLEVQKMLDELDTALARSASKKGAGLHDEAARVVQQATEVIFGGLADSLPNLDAASAARELGSRKHIGVYAALLGEQADVVTRAGRPEDGHALYRRALDLQLESLTLHEDGAEQTRTAIRALRARIPSDA